MKRDAISLTAVVAVIAVCAMIGAHFGEWFGRAGGVAQGDEIVERSRQFERVLGILSDYYAEPFESDDAIYKGAIPAMLERLDPHSQFFSPEQFERLREEQRGSYAGVGMQIRMFQGKTIVDFPFPDTAEGLRTVPGRIMSGVQFFEALIDDQLLPIAFYLDLFERHGFKDVGVVEINPVHAITHP